MPLQTSITKKLALWIGIGAVVVLSGCASFRNNEIAEAGKMPDVSQYKNKPTIFVDSHVYQGEPGKAVLEHIHSKEHLQKIIASTLDNSALFAKYSFNESDKANADYTIRIDIYNHGDIGPAMISGFITGFTLGVIPGAATDNYTLEAKIIDQSGKLVSKVSNKDSITTWIGLVFIPMMGSTTQKALNETLDNQLKAVLKELVESGKLKYSILGFSGNLS